MSNTLTAQQYSTSTFNQPRPSSAMTSTYSTINGQAMNDTSSQSHHSSNTPSSATRSMPPQKLVTTAANNTNTTTTSTITGEAHSQQQQQQQNMYITDMNKRAISPSHTFAAGPPSSNNSAPSSRSGTPVNGGPSSAQYTNGNSWRQPQPTHPYTQSRSQSPASHSRAPSPSPNAPPLSHLISHRPSQPPLHNGTNTLPNNMIPSHSPSQSISSPSSSSQYNTEAAVAQAQATATAAMMQAAYAQQQHHFQNQMAAMLAAGYSQHQLAQHFGGAAQQVQPQYSPNGYQMQSLPPPNMAAGQHHDPRRRAPSLPNTTTGAQSPNGSGLIHNAGYFPSQQQQQQHQQYQHHPQGQSFQHPPSQQYYHPQFAQQQQQQFHQPQYSPSSHFVPPQQPAMRRSPVSSSSAGYSPNRERAPTAPSSLPSSPMNNNISSSNGGNTPSPNSTRSTPNAVSPPFVQNARPASPGGVADLARRRAESQPNESRAPLVPTTAPQLSAYAGTRDRTGSSSSESRKAHLARPSPPATTSSISATPSIQLNHKPSAEFGGSASRIRTDSGTSASSRGSSTHNSAASSQKGSGNNRPASPASVLSDRAPTPTQALHSQLAGSSTSVKSGRTTPTASSSSSSATSINSQQQQQQQQQLGLQPSIKLANGSHEPHCAASGIIRKASPLSQQSTYSDGHRSITPTQASASGIVSGHGPEHDSNDDDDTEEIAPVSSTTANTAASQNMSKHRATLSNASSTMSSSPQTPSSHKSGSSLFRNKLRKAMSLSELNNSSSTVSSSSTNAGFSSSTSKKLGRTSLTSNSSSSDTSHSTAEPRTPPNGAPPVLPRGFASASASNLHGGSGVDEHGMHQQNNGRATPNSGSLPSNAGRRFGILNSKMNSSTDNISISSTVSSASMMLRKMGNFGKLARKSSVRSLSNLFHRDKHDRGDDDDRASTIGGGVSGNGRKVTSDAVSEFGVPGAAMVSSKDRKKGSLADPSVAHVTVELERGDAGKAGASGMTPAEALVRKHQERERIQREEQERHARARTASASSVNTVNSTASTQEVPSPRSRLLEKEKERLKAQNAGKKSLTKKFSFGAFGKSTPSSASLRQDALHAGAANGQSVEDKDKESPRSSSSSSSVNASPIFDSSATSSSSVSPVILQHDLDTKDFSKPLDIDFRPSLDGIQLDTWRKGPAALGGASLSAGVHHHEHAFDDGDDNDEGFDDRTPRQSMELIGDQSVSSSNTGNYSDWDGEPPNTSSYFDDDTASFREEPEHASKQNNAVPAPFYKHQQQSQEGYSSDGGADGRNGQAIPERPHPSARPSKGILKYARSYSQDKLRGPQPAFAGRPRASSYDAPHQMSPPNQPGKMATLAQYIPSGDELDGVASHPSAAPRQDTRVSSPSEIDYNKENLSPSSSASFSPGTSPYNHPNTSEPILSNMKSVHMATRSVTGPIIKRNISFAQNLSVHSTWSGSTYDRRGDTATCNRLTPQLAQAIKEELNAFKMEEMEVHHQSRNYTHFFV